MILAFGLTVGFFVGVFVSALLFVGTGAPRV